MGSFIGIEFAIWLEPVSISAVGVSAGCQV